MTTKWLLGSLGAKIVSPNIEQICPTTINLYKRNVIFNYIKINLDEVRGQYQNVICKIYKRKFLN